MANIAIDSVFSVLAVKSVQAEMPPGHPSLRQVILLGRIKLCESPGDLITEYGAFQTPHPNAFDLLL